ncbi:hypothetical protein HA402_007128 [Bradysia odoriphaga]|nr:hypothetical protein HA402_007128 [Bradysia odoriphaga]
MIRRNNLIVCCLVFLSLILNCFGRLPSSITPCSRNTPNIESCIIAEANKLKPLLAIGDLGDGFHMPPMEPLSLDRIIIRPSPEFNAVFTNLQVNGPTAFVVEKLKADVPNLTFDFSVFLPKLNFTGNYALKMRLLLFNIQGQGPITGTFYNSRGVVRLRGQRVNRNGGEYISFNQLDVKMEVGKSKLKLDNLFNGDPVLSQVGNAFINENTDLFISELIPGLEKSLSKSFLEMVNVIMKDVTFDELFPDS